MLYAVKGWIGWAHRYVLLFSECSSDRHSFGWSLERLLYAMPNAYGVHLTGPALGNSEGIFVSCREAPFRKCFSFR